MRRLVSVISITAVLSPACAKKGSAPSTDQAEYATNADVPSARKLDKADDMVAAAGSAADTGGKEGAKHAPPATWKRSTVVPNATRLTIGDHEELALKSMQAHVAIDGFRARVVIDYTYANDTDRRLEGNFQLRLPEDATPYFFAFGETAFEVNSPKLLIADNGVEPAAIMSARDKTWSHPREARMVPRETAAFAYAQTERRRVDPAIVEWAGAGVFSARVFPLAPHKLQRIVVGYDMDLVRIGDDLEYRFDLPPHVPTPTVDVSVGEPGNATVDATPAVAVHDGGTRRLLHFDGGNVDTFAVRVHGVKSATIAGADATGKYFAAQTTLDLPAVASTPQATAVFAIDTSLSSNPDRFNVFLKLARAVLDRNRGTLARFAVLFFSVDAHWYRPMFLDNTPQNVDAFLAYANTLALEGATDLGAALDEIAHPGWLASGDGGHYDVFLLSDGAATWGEANAYAIAHALSSGNAGSLYAYQTGLAGTDVAMLSELARDTGGAVFSVTGEAEIDKAAVAHRTRPWRLVAAHVPGGDDVMLAGRPRTLFPGQTVTVVGRGEASPLVLDLERDGQRVTVTQPLAPAIDSELAPRTYGQVATAQLEELDGATDAAATAYATHFRITGRTCSLLMLESEADYERFGIVPQRDNDVVKQMPAAALFAKAMAQVAETLGDPKAAFVAMLDKLERTPGVRMTIPAGYRAAIAALPASAFEVKTAPLATKLQTAELLPASLVTALAKHDLDYDALSEDAAARQKLAGAADGLKTLSSLVEEHPGDAVLARDVAFSAMDMGLRPQAYHLLRRVAALRPYEPQTYRAMAQTLADMGKTELALAYYEIPLMGEWDQRFGDLHAIVELDYLHFLRGVIGAGKSPVVDYARSRAAELSQKVGFKRADLVVSIMWNTDNTDVDLHVIEPSGEECFYGHRDTRSGGALTRDVTQGYGPEMYVLPNAPHGTYQVSAHYYASDSNRASARTKVYARTFENWGTPDERVTDKVVKLELGKEAHPIATLQR
jgi:hypothetical protein